MDPLHGQMRLHLETATQGIFRDLLEGALLLQFTSGSASRSGGPSVSFPWIVMIWEWLFMRHR